MLKSNTYKLSVATILIAAIVCVLIDLDFKQWRKLDRVIEHDVHWYYSYLPATFIYDDLKLEKAGEIREGDYYLYWPIKAPNGNYLIKTTMGTAICYAPFFFVSHAYAKISGAPTNGYSAPYKIGLLAGAVVFLIIGLWYVKKILQHFSFTDLQTAITIFLIGLGTNLLCYASQSATMSHVYSFALFAVFIYYSIRWHENQNFKNALFVGLSIGLVSLIRPSNVLIVLFFIFYGVASFADFKNNIRLFIKHYGLIMLIGICIFLVWLPQFLYWKHVTGEYLFYSYTNERFYFTKPKILQGLLSFRKGWLLYTPIMLFALAGILLMKEQLKKLRAAIIIFVILNIYIIFSWWCWWYGGTFGQRSMVESYALLAIPLASFVKFALQKNKIIKLLMFAVCGFFVWLNIFQTYQFERQSLHHDGMTKELYFKQFGKLNKVEDFYFLVSPPDYNEALGISIQEKNTTQSDEEKERKYINIKAYNGKYLSADQSNNDWIIANRNYPDSWELFNLITYKDNRSSLLSYKKLYASANLDDKNRIDAFRDKSQAWEKFTIEYIDETTIAIKAVNNKYVTVDEATGQLFATADSVGEKEKFEIIFKL